MSYPAMMKTVLAATVLAGAAGLARPARAQTLPTSSLGITGTSSLGVQGTSAFGLQGTSALANPAITSGFVNRQSGFFTSGFGGPVVTGFGGVIGPWWSGWWGPWDYGVMYPAVLGPAAFPGAFTPPWTYATANVPVLGINVSPRAIRTRGFSARAIPDVDTPGAARRPRRDARTTAARSSPASVRVTRRLAEVMRTQAVIPGRVEKIGATGVRVKIRRNGRSVTLRYALTDVYSIEGTELFDAASAPDRLKEGDEVMVPERAGRPV